MAKLDKSSATKSAEVKNPFLGPNVRRLRKAAGMTGEALGAAIGKTKGYISQLELGITGASLDTLMALSGALNCRIGDLMDNPDESDVQMREPVAQYAMLPYYNVQGGMGNAQINEHHIEIDGKFPLPYALLRLNGWREAALQVVKAKGESMGNTIRHDDPVVINRDETQIVGGEVYAFLDSDGGLSIKRLHPQPDGRLLIASDNTNKLVYPDVYVPLRPLPIKVLGHVVHRSGAP